MSPVHIALLSLASVLGGAALGMFVRSVLPQDHLSADTKDTVKLAMGLVATMTALVLGLLVASAKGHMTRRGTSSSRWRRSSLSSIVCWPIAARMRPKPARSCA